MAMFENRKMQPAVMGKKIFCTMTFYRDGQALTGYVLEGGGFRFYIGGRIQDFESLEAVWDAFMATAGVW